MLGRRLRPRPNIDPTLVQCLVLCTRWLRQALVISVLKCHDLPVLYTGPSKRRSKQCRPSIDQTSSSSSPSGSSGNSAMHSSPVLNNEIITQSYPQLGADCLTVSKTHPASSKESSPIATSNGSVTSEPGTNSQLTFSTGVYQIYII